jgi:hypothetical protein
MYYDIVFETLNLPAESVPNMISAAAGGANYFYKDRLILLLIQGTNQYRLNDVYKVGLCPYRNKTETTAFYIKSQRWILAFFKASYSDESWNIYFEEEAASVDALSIAQAPTERRKVFVRLREYVNNNMSRVRKLTLGTGRRRGRLAR